ncbi:MAG: site-specific integrase [Dehalococcoidia bacterium]
MRLRHGAGRPGQRPLPLRLARRTATGGSDGVGRCQAADGGGAGRSPRARRPAGGRLLLDAYLARLRAERNLSALTLRNYGADIAHFLDWLDSEALAPADVDRRVFRRYLAALDTAAIARASWRAR